MAGWVDPEEAAASFERWLSGQPLAERSRREYARNVRAFCAWLAATPDRADWGADPLTDPLARVPRRARLQALAEGRAAGCRRERQPGAGLAGCALSPARAGAAPCAP